MSMLRAATASRLLATAACSSPRVAAGLVSAEATAVRLSGVALTTTRRNLGTSKEIGEGLEDEKMRPGDRSQVHFRATPTKHPLGMGSASQSSSVTSMHTPGMKGKEWSMPNQIWTEEEVNSIKPTHKEPEEAVDHITLRGVRTLRWCFDVLAGFKTGVIDEHK